MLAGLNCEVSERLSATFIVETMKFGRRAAAVLLQPKRHHVGELSVTIGFAIVDHTANDIANSRRIDSALLFIAVVPPAVPGEEKTRILDRGVGNLPAG